MLVVGWMGVLWLLLLRCCCCSRPSKMQLGLVVLLLLQLIGCFCSRPPKGCPVSLPGYLDESCPLR